MRALKTVGCLIFLLVIAGATCAWGVFPRVITYQGLLKDANDNPLNGTYTLDVKIYNAATGDGAGILLWSEQHTNVSVENGVFDIRMGESTPFDEQVDFSQSLWLGLSVNSGPEMVPRIMFAAVPTSLMAKTVEDNALTADKIKSGEVVKSINGITDNVVIAAGENITLSPSESTITINAPLQISCNWSGWKPAAIGCSGSTPTPVYSWVIQLNCSGGDVIQARHIQIVRACTTAPAACW